ncbi:cyclic nucleotide-binding domain-containing protein, partial [Candidatus Poribacteria bacterium]|nr:cyclic nucleotide-binding domain-containing protein [Candidatus Poribacteria bacterium]
MAQPAPSDIATRWLSQSTLDELVRLAEKSPKEFQVHFRRLDIRRKLQLRRYLFQRHQDEGYTIPSMLMQPMAKREAAPTPEATSLDGMTIGDALDAAEAEETSSLADLAAPSQTSAAGGGAASLDDLFAAPAETSAAADEAGSLDDLFAAPAEEAPAAESDDGSMSLDDLFGDEAESEQAKAAEEEAEEEVVVDTAAPAGPTDYGVATPVEMPVDDIVAFLKPLPLFEGINDEGFSAIASLMRAERYAGDALLCRQGDQGNVMWVIAEGAVRVTLQGQEIVVLPAGQVVGEMAILDGSPRGTDLITGGETTLLTYTRDAYADTFRRAPDAGMALIKNISTVQQNRLRN